MNLPRQGCGYALRYSDEDMAYIRMNGRSIWAWNLFEWKVFHRGPGDTAWIVEYGVGHGAAVQRRQESLSDFKLHRRLGTAVIPCEFEQITVDVGVYASPVQGWRVWWSLPSLCTASRLCCGMQVKQWKWIQNAVPAWQKHAQSIGVLPLVHVRQSAPYGGGVADADDPVRHWTWPSLSTLLLFATVFRLGHNSPRFGGSKQEHTRMRAVALSRALLHVLPETWEFRCIVSEACVKILPVLPVATYITIRVNGTRVDVDNFRACEVFSQEFANVRRLQKDLACLCFNGNETGLEPLLEVLSAHPAHWWMWKQFCEHIGSKLEAWFLRSVGFENFLQDDKIVEGTPGMTFKAASTAIHSRRMLAQLSTYWLNGRAEFVKPWILHAAMDKSRVGRRDVALVCLSTPSNRAIWSPPQVGLLSISLSVPETEFY